MKSDFKYKMVISALRLFAVLPLPVLYVLSDVMYVAVYHLAGYRKKVVRANLEMVFGTGDREKILKIEKGFYHHLCDCIVETVKLLHISDKEIDRRVIVTNGELVDDIINSGHSVVLLLGHYCNWEWVQAIIHHFKAELVGGQIYKPLHNKVMDEVMLKIRSRFGLECVPQQKTVRRLLDIERSGRHFVMGFISDQRPIGRNLHNWTDFMGIDTPYAVGGEVVGEHVGARFLYVDMKKVKRGHYSLTFRPIVPDDNDKDPNPYTRTFMKMLEKSIYAAPQYWLWSHKRWKKHRTSPSAR